MVVSQKTKGIMTLIGSFCFQFMVGSLYTWAAINPYFTSYLKVNGNPDIHQLDVYFILPIILALQYALLPVGNLVGDLIGTRIVTAIATCSMLLSYIFIKVFPNYGFVLFSIIIFGIGNSMAFLYVIKNGWKYFPTRTGMVSGVILGGMGITSAILNPLSDFVIINPEQKPPNSEGFYDQDICDNFDTYLIFIIVLFAILTAISIGLTWDFKPEVALSNATTKEIIKKVFSQELKIDDGSLPTSNNQKENEQVQIIRSPSIEPIIVKEEDIDEKKKEEKRLNAEQTKKDQKDFFFAMKSKKCIMLFVICFVGPFFCILLTNTNRAFGNLNGLDQGGLQIMSVILAFLNGVCRFGWGLLIDKFRFRVLMGVILFIQLAISISVYFSAKNLYAYIILNCLIGLCTAGVFTILPPTFNRIFGVKLGAKIYSYGGIFIGFASLLGPILTRFLIKDSTSYLIVYLISGGLILIAIILLFILNEDVLVYEPVTKHKLPVNEDNQIKETELCLTQNNKETHMENKNINPLPINIETQNGKTNGKEE